MPRAFDILRPAARTLHTWLLSPLLVDALSSTAWSACFKEKRLMGQQVRETGLSSSVRVRSFESVGVSDLVKLVNGSTYASFGMPNG